MYIKPTGGLTISARDYGWDNQVWMAGGDRGGAASKEGLIKMLNKAEDVEIESLLPLNADFFDALPPTLESLSLPNLHHGPGLAEALARLADRTPELTSLSLSVNDGNIPREAEEMAGDAWRWSDDDSVDVALAVLSIPQLDKIDVRNLLDGIELSPEQHARFEALPALENLKKLSISNAGHIVIAELLADKIQSKNVWRA